MDFYYLWFPSLLTLMVVLVVSDRSCLRDKVLALYSDEAECFSVV